MNFLILNGRGRFDLVQVELNTEPRKIRNSDMSVLNQFVRLGNTCSPGHFPKWKLEDEEIGNGCTEVDGGHGRDRP